MAIITRGYELSSIAEFLSDCAETLTAQGLFDSVTNENSTITCTKNGVDMLTLGYGSGGKFVFKNSNNVSLWEYDLRLQGCATVSRCGTSVVITSYSYMAGLIGVDFIVIGKTENDKIFVMYHGFYSTSNHFMFAFAEDAPSYISEDAWKREDTSYTRLGAVCVNSLSAAGVVPSEHCYRIFNAQTIVPPATNSNTLAAVTPTVIGLDGNSFLSDGYYVVMDDVG